MENKAQSLSGLKREDFQKIVQGKEVDLFFLRNANGMDFLELTTMLSTTTILVVPDLFFFYAAKIAKIHIAHLPFPILLCTLRQTLSVLLFPIGRS